VQHLPVETDSEVPAFPFLRCKRHRGGRHRTAAPCGRPRVPRHAIHLLHAVKTPSSAFLFPAAPLPCRQLGTCVGPVERRGVAGRFLVAGSADAPPQRGLGL